MATNKPLGDILANSKNDKPKTIAEKHEALKLQAERLKNAAEYSREKALKRYQESWQYALGKRPFPLMGDPDLNQVINVMAEAAARLKPSLLSIFAENEQQPVIFRAQGFKRNKFLEAAVNNTISRLTFKDSDILKTLTDAFTEAMYTGDSFVKYFFEETIEKDKFELEDWTALDDILGQLQDITVRTEGDTEWVPDVPDATDEDGNLLESHPETEYKGIKWKVGARATQGGIDIASGDVQLETEPMMFIKGSLGITKTNYKFRLNQVDLNDLWFDDNYCSEDFGEHPFICHRTVMPVYKAIAAGYPKKKVMEAPDADNLDELPLNKRDIVVDYTNPGFNDENRIIDKYSVDPMTRNIAIYEYYFITSLWTGKPERIQLTMTDNQGEVLDVRVIDDNPFAHFQYETIPGSFWGRSLFDICKGPQDELSHIARVMKRHMTLSVYNRFIGVKGAFDKQSVIANRPGAVIEVVDSVENFQPFPVHPLDPAVATYLQYMRDNADRVITNSSDTLQGIEKNPQLAANTVAMMIEQLEMKDKAIAKNFARTGVRPMNKGIYKLLKFYRYHMINEDGSVIPPEALPESGDWVIDFSTVNDTAKQNNLLLTTAQAIAALPPSDVITSKNKVAMAKRILDSEDLDVNEFYTDPESQQLSPEEQEEQQNAAKAAKAGVLLDLDNKRGANALLARQIMLVEQQTKEIVADGIAKREREKEKSLRDFQKTKSEVALNEAKAKAEADKVAIQAGTANAEVQTGRDINGIPNMRT